MKRLAGCVLCVLAIALWPEGAAEPPAAGNAMHPDLEVRLATGTLPRVRPAAPPPSAVPVVIEHGVEVRLRRESVLVPAEREAAAADEARESELAPAEPVPPAPAREPPPPVHLSADD